MSAQSVAGDGAAYSYRASLAGAPRLFKLTAEGIEWIAGPKSGLVPYRAIRRLRMSYRPANMQSHRFVTEIWADGASKLQIVSSSWKSLFEQERLDGSYSAFVTDLHRRITAAGAPVRFEQGSGAQVDGYIFGAPVSQHAPHIIIASSSTSIARNIGSGSISHVCLSTAPLEITVETQ